MVETKELLEKPIFYTSDLGRWAWIGNSTLTFSDGYKIVAKMVRRQTAEEVRNEN